MWDDILKFLNDNKDGLGVLFGSGVIIAILGTIFRWIISLVKARRTRKTRSNENFPFKIINPNSNVAKEILGGADHDPLADRNIPYQQRIADRNIRREIEDDLTRSHYVLIVGKTGLGKTREAIHLAESLNKEGWTILYLTRDQWLAAPAKLPDGLPERKLLFLLDDLNRKMYASRVEQSPKADELLEPLTMPLQQRLNETLETFEKLCGKNEVMVIGTARNETFSQFHDEPSEWDKLEFKRYSSFWKRFTLFELPEPNDEAEVNFLNQMTQTTNAKAKPTDFGVIAKRNDGTFSNIVENIKTAVNKDVEFDLTTFRDSLNGTWEKRYKDATIRFPVAHAIYDAVDLCREAKLELSFDNVFAASFLFVNNHRIIKMVNSIKLFLTIRKLEKTENILLPRDGQIEAKGSRADTHKHLHQLYRQIFYETRKSNSKLKNFVFWLRSRLLLIPKSAMSDEKTTPWEILLALFNDLGIDLNSVGQSYGKLGFSEIEIVCYKKSLTLSRWNFLTPKNIRLGATQWNNLGYAYITQKQYDEAINAYQRAIKIDPKSLLSWCNLGFVYFVQEQYEQAMNAYQKAIQTNPKTAYPWNGLGNVYNDQEQYEQAKTHYQKAIQIDPKFAHPWNGLGNTYRSQEQYEQAINAYQKTIQIDPKFAHPWNALGNIYRLINNNEEALNAYQQAAKLLPQDGVINCSLLATLRRMGRNTDADEQEKITRPLMEKESIYDRACFAAICKNVDEALDLLKESLEKENVDLAWLRKDPDFDFIRDDPRFNELVGLI